MQIGSTTPVAGTPAVGREKAAGLALGYEAFLQLLLAQLKNQDPTNPMDSTTYVSQLATLSNLEQVIQQSEKLDAILDAEGVSQAAALVGRSVTSQDGSVSGIVVSVHLTDSGLIATLESGAEMTVGDGMRIST